MQILPTVFKSLQRYHMELNMKKTIDLFIERHKIKMDIILRILSPNTECKIGGRGDYIYQDTG